MKNTFKKMISAALACCVLAGGLPSAAYAEGGEAPVVTEVPVTPEPATPVPATPVPVTPEPATPVPATEVPITPEPATPVPVTEDAATEAPAAEVPVTEAPATEVPATEAPATEAPATEVPATEAPATEAPATEVPATEAPVTEVPVTEAPATEAPATEVPVTEAPATEAPATEAPVPAAAQLPGVGSIEKGVLYITGEDVALGEMPAAAPYEKIVIREEAKADFGKLEVTLPLVIEEKAVLLGGVFLGEVKNDGVIEGGTFREKVSNGSEGLILGGSFEKEINKIAPGSVDFKNQFVYGGSVFDRKIPADWMPDCEITAESIRFEDEDIYEFGISADAAAAAPASTGVSFQGLVPESGYAVFARAAIIDGDWTRLNAVITTAAAAEPEATEAPADAETAVEATEAPADAEITVEATEEPADAEATEPEETQAPAEDVPMMAVMSLRSANANAQSDDSAPELTGEEIAAANVQVTARDYCAVKLSIAAGYEASLWRRDETLYADENGWFHLNNDSGYSVYVRRAAGEGAQQSAWTYAGFEAEPYFLRVRLTPETPVEGAAVRAIVDTNLPGDASLIYEWFSRSALADAESDDWNSLKSGVDAFYTTSAADAGCEIRVRVSWEQDKRLSDFSSTQSVSARELPGAPALAFDYDQDMFILTMQEAPQGDFLPGIENETTGMVWTVTPDSGETRYTYPLRQLGMAEGKNTFYALLQDHTGRTVYGEHITLEQPAMTAEEIAAANVQVSGQSASCEADYELRAVDVYGYEYYMEDGRFSGLRDGESYTLQLRKKGDQELKRLASKWVKLEEHITASVPKISAIICNADNPDASVSGAVPGDRLLGRAEIQEAGYVLPDDIAFSWYRDDGENVSPAAVGEIYTVTEADAGCKLRVGVSSASEGWSIPWEMSNEVSVDLAGATVSVDYEAERIEVTFEREGRWNAMLFADAEMIYASGSKTISASLDRLLADPENTAVQFYYNFTNASDGDMVGGSFFLKARPEFDGESVAVTVEEIGARSAKLSCADPAYQPGLLGMDGAYIWADASGLADGLDPNTDYSVVLRRTGSNAQECFASRAGAADAENGGIMFTTLPALSAEITASAADEYGVPGAYEMDTFGSEQEAGNISCSWYAVDLKGNETLLAETGGSCELILTDAQKAELFFKRVKVVVKDNISNETAFAISDVHGGNLAGSLDYENETMNLFTPAAVTEDCVLHVNGKAYAWESGSAQLTLNLNDFSLPAAWKSSLGIELIHEESGVSTGYAECSVPARPVMDVSGISVSASGRNIHISGIPAGYRIGMMQSGNQIEEEFTVVSGEADGVIRDLGKPCYVRAWIPASNENGNFASLETTVRVIPASFGFALKRQNASGSISALEYGSRAGLGDKLVVVLAEGTENVRCRWLRNGEEIPGAQGLEYQTCVQDFKTTISVEVIQETDAGQNTGVSSAQIAYLEFAMQPDFAAETLRFTAPCALSGGWSLRTMKKTVAWPEGADSAAFSLEELGVSIEGSSETTEFYMVAGSEEIPAASFQYFSLPNRKDYAGGDVTVKEAGRTSILLNTVDDGVEAGLSVAGAAAPEFFSNEGFENLMAGVEYQLWMRNAATQTAFASRWKAAQGTVRTSIAVAAGEPSARIDFVNEKLVITAPEDIPTEETGSWNAVLSLKVGGGLTGFFKAGQRDCSLTLKLINLPDDTTSEAGHVYLERGSASSGDEMRSRSAAITIPCRPAFSGNAAEVTVKKTDVSAQGMRFSCTEGYEVVLKGSQGYIRSNGKNEFTGLKAGAQYEVYVCNSATDTSFASVPASINAVTSTLPFDLKVDKSSIAVGETITATLSTGGADYPDLVYTWYIYSSGGMRVAASGANRVRYTARAGDAGGTLLVEVSSESAGVSTWIQAATVTAAPTPRPTATMPIASDDPKVTATPTVSPSPTPTYNTNWGSYDDDFGDDGDDADDDGSDYDFYGEPEADGQGYDESERLYDDYLLRNTGWDSIVFDAEGLPADYEMLPIYREQESDGRSLLMVLAQPSAEGDIVNRELRLYLDQLNKLYAQKGLDMILFRNGDADAWLNIGEVLTGDIAKIARTMLSHEGEVLDPLDVDLEGMEEALLTSGEMRSLYLALGINPVPLDEENTAWEFSVRLLSENGVECDISNMLFDFTVCLNVHGLFEEEEKDAFTQSNTIALMDMEADGGEILLESELIVVPDETPVNMVDEAEYFSVSVPMEEGAAAETYYEEAIPLDFYRNYALSSYYAGPGAYLLAEYVEEF